MKQGRREGREKEEEASTEREDGKGQVIGKYCFDKRKAFENTQFTNNLGVYGPRNRPGGGAIYAEGYFFFVNVSNSVFSQNVGEYGGAIYGAYPEMGKCENEGAKGRK